MRTYIRVPDALRKELISKFGVSRPTVWSALNYLTAGDRPEAIRQYALQHGGSIEEQNFIPNCRTEYTDEEIVQTFAGGVQVRTDRNDGIVRLVQDGAVVESYEAVTLQAWGNILHRAQMMSQGRVARAAKK